MFCGFLVVLERVLWFSKVFLWFSGGFGACFVVF